MTALCHKFGEVHIVHAFTRIVQIVYVPGIFFAVGYYIQIQSEKYGDFKGCMLRHAAYSLGLYALLGIRKTCGSVYDNKEFHIVYKGF